MTGRAQDDRAIRHGKPKSRRRDVALLRSKRRCQLRTDAIGPCSREVCYTRSGQFRLQERVCLCCSSAARRWAKLDSIADPAALAADLERFRQIGPVGRHAASQPPIREKLDLVPAGGKWLRTHAARKKILSTLRQIE